VRPREILVKPKRLQSNESQRATSEPRKPEGTEQSSKHLVSPREYSGRQSQVTVTRETRDSELSSERANSGRASSQPKISRNGQPQRSDTLACLPLQLPVLLFTSLSLCVSSACTLLTPSYFPLPAPARTLLSHSFLSILQPALPYPCPVSIRLNRPSSHFFLPLPRQFHLNFPPSYSFSFLCY
jgi:hypothetical protein